METQAGTEIDDLLGLKNNFMKYTINGVEIQFDTEDILKVCNQLRLWRINEMGYVEDQTGCLLSHIIMNHRSNKDTRVNHKDGNKLDYRKMNLRICSNRESTIAAKLRKTNTSGYRGICFRSGRKSKPWQAQITVNGKQLYLGMFKKAATAAQAYNVAALKHFGEFAVLNQTPTQIRKDKRAKDKKAKEQKRKKNSKKSPLLYTMTREEWREMKDKELKGEPETTMEEELDQESKRLAKKINSVQATYLLKTALKKEELNREEIFKSLIVYIQVLKEKLKVVEDEMEIRNIDSVVCSSFFEVSKTFDGDIREIEKLYLENTLYK